MNLTFNSYKIMRFSKIIVRKCYIICGNHIFLVTLHTRVYFDDYFVFMTTDEKYMTMALHEARLAYEQGEIPVGCVIVADNTIIGRGHNLTQMLHDVTAHAEMQAITAATETLGGKYLQGCTLYVTVEPCIMCAGAIGWAQISRLVYGAPDPKRGYATFAPQALHPKCTVTSGVLADECRQLMQEFFADRRK